MSVELPRDAEGREIPLDTTVLYSEDGKCFKVNRFTYSVVQTIPGLKWGVVFMDCRYDYCSSFYLTPPEPPDSWEKLLEDLDRGANALPPSGVCAYSNKDGGVCADCLTNDGTSCDQAVLRDIASRIRTLRGEDA